MGFDSHYVSSPGCCFSTENYKKEVIEHYYNSDDNERITPDLFFYLFVLVAKNIDNLQITFVIINSHIESHYRATVLEIYILIIVIDKNLSLRVVMIDM